jgi:predicted enzyme related to lactoylglutathione lyase
MNTRNQTRSTRSAVDFPTLSRPHIGLPVRDLDAAMRFYETLLGAKPVKERPGYAKFETHEPPLNLTLNQVADGAPPHAVQHFGIQVKSTAEVVAYHGRVRAAGFPTMNEAGVTMPDEMRLWWSMSWTSSMLTGAVRSAGTDTSSRLPRSSSTMEPHSSQAGHLPTHLGSSWPQVWHR